MIAAGQARFAYLAVSHAFAALWPLRMTDREKDAEILALRINSRPCTGDSAVSVTVAA